jgi:rRNA-processing protein FCF1
MSNHLAIKDFEPKASHSYLIDTNILMYIFSPIASYGEKKQESISKFIERCKNVKAGIVTTSFVVGEFFHVNLNMYYNNWCANQKDQIDFKLKDHYRPTQDYKESVEAINRSIELILKISDKFPDNFNNISLSNIASHCYHAEFTDSYLLELSNTKGWIIVSNDGDLINHPNRKQPIITSN